MSMSCPLQQRPWPLGPHLLSLVLRILLPSMLPLSPMPLAPPALPSSPASPLSLPPLAVRSGEAAVIAAVPTAPRPLATGSPALLSSVRSGVAPLPLRPSEEGPWPGALCPLPVVEAVPRLAAPRPRRASVLFHPSVLPSALPTPPAPSLGVVPWRSSLAVASMVVVALPSALVRVVRHSPC